MLRLTSSARAVVLFLTLGAALAVAAPAPPAETTFQFGERQLTVPTPSGFLAASPSSPQLVEMLQAYQPSTNRPVEVFVEPENFAAVQAGEASGLNPYFQLSVLRSADGMVLSSADFSQKLESMERELEAAMGKAGDTLSDQMKRGNESVKQQHGFDPSVKIAPPIFLGTHRREPWGIFFSIRMMVTSAAEDGTSQVAPTVSSVAFVLINHQLMYLAAYRDESDSQALQWTRDSLDDWAAQLRAANPDDPGLERGAKRFGIDWRRAAGVGLATGVGAGFISLVVILITRRNKRGRQP